MAAPAHTTTPHRASLRISTTSVDASDMAVRDHPRYAEWRAAFKRMIAAQDRVHETLGWDWEAAQAEHERALAAYQKICDEMGM
jgi:hypothetical protein